MRSKLVMRHYCDHCGKGRFHRTATDKHEARCIYNPNRKCPFCSAMHDSPKPMDELIAALDASLDELRSVSQGCPTCMLAAIVQQKKRDGDDFEDVNFDYKKEREEWYHENTEAIPVF